MCRLGNQRLRTLRGEWFKGKGHKSFQVWNEMILEDTRGFKCQLEENTNSRTSFSPRSLQRTSGVLFFSIPRLKDGAVKSTMAFR